MIIAFESVTQAQKAKQVLPEGKLIPTPRSISVSCGMSLQIEADKEVALQALANAGVQWMKVA